MKRFISFVLIIFILIMTAASVFALNEQRFDDVPDSAWYHNAVCEAVDLGYFIGTGNGRFSPDAYLTRAMLVQCLAKAASADISSYNNRLFNDVTSDKWYFNACNWAADCGLVSGIGNGCFAPNTNLTREQLCVIMTHFQERFGAPFNYRFDYIPFVDDTTISGWAYDYVHTLRNTGSITARVNGYFVPKAFVSRAELAVILLSCTGHLDVPPVDPDIHVYGIQFSGAEISVEEEKTAPLTMSVLPVNATNPVLTVVSSDPSVAIYYNGTVYAFSPGKAVFTVTAADGGITASVRVTVTEKPKPAPEPPPVIRKTDPKKPMIALTFDDGPDKVYSNQILDILEQYGAAATFFETGASVEYCPEVIIRGMALGCEYGSHTYSHPSLLDISDGEIRSQLKKTNDAFIKACGKAPTIMRPPYGARNAHTDSLINMPVILWSVDTLDWKYHNSDYIYRYVIKNAGDGDIVLMHIPLATTVDALKRIVPELIRRGYQLVTVSELAQGKGCTMKNGRYYSSFKK